MRIAVGLLALAAVATPAAGRGRAPIPGHVVAITFDDLPFVGADQTDPRAAAAAERRIVLALTAARVPATGFVNEDKVRALGPMGVALLRPWNQGLLALGNHGYDHFDVNKVDVAKIEEEVTRGEATIGPLAASAGRTVRFFRFPYNHVGDTEAKRLASEAVLARHGLRLAATTIDTSDWQFDAAYERAQAAHDRSAATRVRRAYLAYTALQIAYYDRLDRQVLGRDAPAIMLLHANRLNAATIRPLIRLFRDAGYGFISLDTAQSDPAYATSPAYATPYGPMWGYRWAKERGVKVDGRLEQDSPAWVTAQAGRRSE